MKTEQRYSHPVAPPGGAPGHITDATEPRPGQRVRFVPFTFRISTRPGGQPRFSQRGGRRSWAAIYSPEIHPF